MRLELNLAIYFLEHDKAKHNLDTVHRCKVTSTWNRLEKHAFAEVTYEISPTEDLLLWHGPGKSIILEKYKVRPSFLKFVEFLKTWLKCWGNVLGGSELWMSCRRETVFLEWN